MKSKKSNKKAIVLAISSILALQQATAPAIASTIIDAGGNLVEKGNTGNYEFKPDAFNKDIGFKYFKLKYESPLHQSS